MGVGLYLILPKQSMVLSLHLPRPVLNRSDLHFQILKFLGQNPSLSRESPGFLFLFCLFCLFVCFAMFCFVFKEFGVWVEILKKKCIFSPLPLLGILLGITGKINLVTQI